MTPPGRRMPSERGILGDPLCEHNYPTMAINTDAGHYALRAACGTMPGDRNALVGRPRAGRCWCWE